MTEYINKFLATLSKEDRVIFLKRYWFCQAYSEIAASVNLSEKNVSVRLTRTRKKLKKYLEKDLRGTGKHSRLVEKIQGTGNRCP